MQLSGQTDNSIPISEEFCEEMDGDENLSLADIWAEIITGPDKQDVTAMIVSEKGAGKSYSALRMAIDIAEGVAARVGGTWKDYFPYNEETGELPNVACIDIKDIVNLVGSMKKYNIYIFDDIGVGLNARKWQQESNIIVNDVIEIARTGRSCSIFTVMDQSFVDRVIREIIGWHLEISESRHKEGYNIMKVLKSKKQFRTGKLHRVYIKRNGARLVRCIVESPPDYIAAAYDKLRDRKTDELKKERIDQFMKSSEPDTEIKVNPLRKKKLDFLKTLVPEIDDAIAHGMTAKEAIYDVGERYKIQRKTIEGYIRNKDFAELGVPT